LQRSEAALMAFLIAAKGKPVGYRAASRAINPDAQNTEMLRTTVSSLRRVIGKERLRTSRRAATYWLEPYDLKANKNPFAPMKELVRQAEALLSTAKQLQKTIEEKRYESD